MNMLETSFCSPLLFPVYYQIRLISRFVFRQGFSGSYSNCFYPPVSLWRNLKIPSHSGHPGSCLCTSHPESYYGLLPISIHTGRTKKNSRKISLPAALCSHADFFRNSQRIQKYAKSNRSAVTKIYQAMESVSVAILWSLPADRPQGKVQG